jgi:polar amino acid transport system substrate-binding protein
MHGRGDASTRELTTTELEGKLMPRPFDRPACFSAWRAPALLFATIAAASVLALEQPLPLRLVSTPWPPFTNEPGRPRYALDLVEAALGRVGISSTTTMVDPAQFMPALMAGEFDGSAAAWHDPEREGALIFSQPYLENRLVLVGRLGTDVSAATLTSLTGKRIAIVEGYSYGDAISAGPAFIRSASEEDSLAMLLADRVDYVLMDELVVQYIVEHHTKEAASRLQLGSTPLVRRELHLAVRRTRPDAESIVSRFNAQLRGMIADGTYHRLLHVAWIRADMDDDGLAEYVAQSERLGRSEPQRAYWLFSATEPLQPQPGLPDRGAAGTSRFYVGGNIYSDWATVPDTYKLTDAEIENPSRSTASIFRFTW